MRDDYTLLWDLQHAGGQGDATGALTNVLLALAMRTDTDGTTNVSIREIARHLGQSPGTIQRQVTELVRLGLVENVGRDRKDNRRWIRRISAMDECGNETEVLALVVDIETEADDEPGDSGAVS